MSFSMTIAWYRSSLGKKVTLGSAPSDRPPNISRYIRARRSGVSVRLGSERSRPRSSITRRRCTAISCTRASSSTEGTTAGVSLMRLRASKGRLGCPRLVQEVADVACHRNVAGDDVFDLPVLADHESRPRGDPLVLEIHPVLARDVPLGVKVGEQRI